MSAKHGEPKLVQETYMTPRWVCESLLRECSLPVGRWLEPCAGTGNIIQAVNSVRDDVEWTAVELLHEYESRLRATGARVRLGDFLDVAFRAQLVRAHPKEAPFRVVMTNPPYSKTAEFLNACREVSELVVFLLRLNYLEGAERALFWRSCPPDVYVLPNRPSFTGGGTDATAYAWFVVPGLFYRGVVERRRGRLCVLATVDAKDRK